MATAEHLATRSFVARWSPQFTFRSWAIQVSCAISLVSGFGWLSIEHLTCLWRRSHYQFFPFVLAASLYFVWKRWPSVVTPSRCSVLCGSATIVVCALMQAVTVWLNSPWLAAVNALWLLSAWCLMSRGFRFFMNIASAWMLLWLLVPLPLQWDTFLIDGLQTLSVHIASGVADLLGQNHLVQGHVIRIPGQLLLVDEACSGVQSLFATLALVSVFAVWKRRPLVVSGLLLVSTSVWVAITNVTRITTIVVVNSQTSWDLSVGWPHHCLGLLLFPMTALGLLATDRLLQNLLAPINSTDSRLAVIWDRIVTFPELQSASDVANQRVEQPGWFVVGCLVLLGVWSLAVQLPRAISQDHSSPVTRQRTHLTHNSLPQKLGRWTRAEYQTGRQTVTGAAGTHTHTWNYHLGSRRAILSFDYPFRGWHRLEVCYAARGWSVIRTTEHGVPQSSWVECLLRRSSGEHAILCYRMFHIDGRVMSGPGDSVASALKNRFGNVLSPQIAQAETTQFQMFVSQNSEPTATERQAIHREFERFSEVIRSQAFQEESVHHE